jgi:methyl-accepting chemotaxis protein
MRRLQDIGVAKRLGLIVGTGSVLLAALAGINLYGQHRVAEQSRTITGLEQGLGALNHLETGKGQTQPCGACRTSASPSDSVS